MRSARRVPCGRPSGGRVSARSASTRISSSPRPAGGSSAHSSPTATRRRCSSTRRSGPWPHSRPAPTSPVEEYARAQAAFDADLLAALTAAGLGVVLRDLAVPDAEGRTPWRIDPSVIATDVQSAAAGKDLGARRALALLAAD